MGINIVKSSKATTEIDWSKVQLVKNKYDKYYVLASGIHDESTFVGMAMIGDEIENFKDGNKTWSKLSFEAVDVTVRFSPEFKVV